MDILAIIAVLATTVESLVEYIGELVTDHKLNWKQIAAIVLGVALAFLAPEADLYAAIGITFSVPFVGNILTGLVFCRGANYLSDFVTRVQGSKK